MILNSQLPVSRTLTPKLSSGKNPIPAPQKQPEDLIEITGETKGEAVWAGVKLGGMKLVDRGLPVAGAAFAGMPGLLAGAAAVGVKDALSTGSIGRGVVGTLGSGLVGFGIVSVSNFVAGKFGINPLGVAAALTGLSAAASGYTEGMRTYMMPEIKVNEDRFADAFLSKAEQKMQQRGQSLDLPPIPGGLTESEKDKAQSALVMMATMKGSEFSGKDPMVWAGEVVQELATDNDERRIDAVQVRMFPELAPATKEGDVTIRVTDTMGMSPAMAVTKTVLMDRSFSEKPAATVDFVKGHELSHVTHEDLLARLGENALIDMCLEGTEEMMPGYEGRLMAGMLSQTLTAESAAISREKELRADLEGFDYAIKAGHTADQIIAGAKDTLSGGMDMKHPWSTHPPSSERIEALRQHAKKAS